MQEINIGAMIRLKHARHLLTAKQYRTIRGQILAGDAMGAMRGLRRLLERRSPAAVKNKK